MVLLYECKTTYASPPRRIVINYVRFARVSLTETRQLYLHTRAPSGLSCVFGCASKNLNRALALRYKRVFALHVSNPQEGKKKTNVEEGGGELAHIAIVLGEKDRGNAIFKHRARSYYGLKRFQYHNARLNTTR